MSKMGVFDDEILFDSEIPPENDEGDDEEESDIEMTAVFRIKTREKTKVPVKISTRSLEEQENINRAKNIAKKQAKS